MLRRLLKKTPCRGYFWPTANRLGWQVLRVCYYYAAYRLRRLLKGLPKAPNIYAEMLARDGVVVIPDLLPEEDFAKLRAHYHTTDFGERDSDVSTGPKLQLKICTTPHHIEDEEVYRMLVTNKVMNECIVYAAAKKMYLYPYTRMHRYSATAKEMGIREETLTDTLHYDVPLNNFRCFYFIEPCNRNNAAFEYAIGSNRINLARIKLEYYDSIMQAEKRGGKNKGAKVQPIDQSLLDAYQAHPEPIEAQGNSLVIFNTMGLHRRGTFAVPGERHAILIDYRQMDSLDNIYKWLVNVFTR